MIYAFACDVDELIRYKGQRSAKVCWTKSLPEINVSISIGTRSIHRCFVLLKGLDELI